VVAVSSTVTVGAGRGSDRHLERAAPLVAADVDRRGAHARREVIVVEKPEAPHARTFPRRRVPENRWRIHRAGGTRCERGAIFYPGRMSRRTPLAHLRALFALFLVVLVGAACPPPGASDKKADDKKGEKADKGEKGDKDDDEDRDEQPEKFKPPPPRPIEEDRIIRSLEAEVAALKQQIADGKTSQLTGIINAHEHLYKLKDLDKYLPAARKAGIAATVVVASPVFTLEGKGEKGEPGMSRNFEDVLLEAAKQYPGEIIPFCTLDPNDNNKLERLKKHVEMGCKGLKMYSGHSNFVADQGPLDKPDMDPVYAYLEETQLPVLWHVNLAKLMDDFEKVIAKHPNMNLMVPHYGVAFWKPKDATLARLKDILRKHPNIYVDTSLGTREILLNGMAAMEPALDDFRAFFQEFQNQIVWGTDSVITGNVEKTPGWFNKVIWATRDHLEKDVFTTELAAAYSKYYQKGRDGEGRYQGLHLETPILQKVYIDNPKKWLRLK
jgi:predicted TIM-barrel fold metal-dependent hydrolase